MAVFNVTNLLDMGAGSLRDAINMANINPGADTIEFDAGLSSGSIGLSSDELLISDSVTINGLGANFLTVDAQMNNFRVFNIDDGDFGNFIDVFINDLTITGGNSSEGGGIRTSESLTITDSTISGNSAGFRGGGIYSVNGNTTIVNSTISGNSSSVGGGIYSYRETINITNSTISGNSVGGRGGGIFFYYSLGNITNSTISDNSANSGGGIYESYGTVNLTNTIIANSTGGDCELGFSASIGNNINNLIEDGSCNPLLSGDPNLGPLQNNGGPTETHELLPGSIAIDAGNNAGAAGLTTDQRGPGFDRIVNGTVDIGAFEVQLSSSPITTSVPEPSSLMGLAILGISTLTLHKRKSPLKKKTKDKEKS